MAKIIERTNQSQKPTRKTDVWGTPANSKAKFKSKVKRYPAKPPGHPPLVASAYEKWHWFQFWRKNEVQIVQQWATALAPGKILDAGSGTGLYRPVLESTGHRVIGADLSAEMLMIQVRRNPTAAVVQARIEALPFQASSFDYVLCTRVLSHVQTLMPVFREFARVTKQEAALLITDVHPEHRYSEMSIPTN